MAEQKPTKFHKNTKDLTGQSFGKWTAVSYAGTRAHKSRWNCICACGTTDTVVAGNLINGISTQCIKCRNKRRPSSCKDLTGERFGRLTVISEAGRNAQRYILWLCQCRCKTFTTVSTGALVSGNSTSCGCYRKERTSAVCGTHRMSRTSTYAIWCAIIERCFNPNASNFHNYGGRGITMCQEWRESFERFLEDMGPRPKGMSIDRRDNNGPYSKDNCRWATRKEQSENTRRNVYITHNGETLRMKEWAERTGIKYNILSHRRRHGKPLFAPVKKRSPIDHR